jgi:hypothetical protein
MGDQKPGLMDENTWLEPADSVKNPVSLSKCVSFVKITLILNTWLSFNALFSEWMLN